MNGTGQRHSTARACALALLAPSLYLVTLAAGEEPAAQLDQQRTLDMRPSLYVPRTSQPPTLDDFVQGRAREAEARVSGFRQREPHDGQPATEDTSAFLSYDSVNLYVVFVCKDAPDNVRARMAKREDISDDDRVTIYLDSFYDGQRAYVFSSNAFGVQRDGMATEGQGTDFRYDMIWQSSGRLLPTASSCEWRSLSRACASHEPLCSAGASPSAGRSNETPKAVLAIHHAQARRLHGADGHPRRARGRVRVPVRSK